jgi:dimethylamine/trimethylamine dehydrogenase
MSNVEVYLESDLTVDEILAFGFSRVILATGAHWRSDGVGVSNWKPIQGAELSHVVTPDHVFDNKKLSGPLVVFDDDNFYMGAAIAERLKLDGHDVTFVTTAVEVSPWTHNTLEQHRIQSRIMEMGIPVITSNNISVIDDEEITLSCVYTDKVRKIPASGVVMVTSRRPNNALGTAFENETIELEASGIRSIVSIGDCLNPSIIAAAVYDGHRVAREMDAAPENPDMPFLREEILLPRKV